MTSTAGEVALLQVEVGVLGAEDGEADVVELDLVGAGVDGLVGEVDDVLVGGGVGRVEPAHLERPAPVAADGHVEPRLGDDVVVEAADAHDDADAALVGEVDGARQVADGRGRGGLGLDGDRDLRL